MAEASLSLRWLHLAVLGPLLLLAALAWWGTRSQLDAAWAEARNEAELLAPKLASEVAADLEKAIIKVPSYPDPPVPGLRTAADDLLDSEDIKALSELAADPDAGLSPAGLPRRPQDRKTRPRRPAKIGLDQTPEPRSTVRPQSCRPHGS